jgi:hypothetical protein
MRKRQNGVTRKADAVIHDVAAMHQDSQFRIHGIAFRILAGFSRIPGANAIPASFPAPGRQALTLPQQPLDSSCCLTHRLSAQHFPWSTCVNNK